MENSKNDPGYDADIDPGEEVAQDVTLALPIHRNLRPIGRWLRTHSEFAPERIAEQQGNLAALVAQGRESFSRHKKAYAAAGAVALGGFGFTAGALTFAHRHAD